MKRKMRDARFTPGMVPSTRRTRLIRGTGAEPLRRRAAHPRRSVRTLRSPTVRVGWAEVDARRGRSGCSHPCRANSAAGRTGAKCGSARPDPKRAGGGRINFLTWTHTPRGASPNLQGFELSILLPYFTSLSSYLYSIHIVARL